METTERYTTLQEIHNTTMREIHLELLLGNVTAFVTRITEISNDPDLIGPDRRAMMAGAAEGFKEVFATNLEMIDKHNEVSR